MDERRVRDGTLILTQSLELFPIGNCAASALIDEDGRFVWACAPRVDGDPFFSGLLGDRDPAGDDARDSGRSRSRTPSRPARPICATRRSCAPRSPTRHGGALEIIDFCPRYRQFGRIYRPLAFVRLIRPLERRAAHPHPPAPDRQLRRAAPATTTYGSNHIRYVGGAGDAAADHRRTGQPHPRGAHCSGWRSRSRCSSAPTRASTPTSPAPPSGCCARRPDYWRGWVRTLSVPLEWQEAVIRAAITLKLCAYEETGAIVAALTTSIPEHAVEPGEPGRNWDYRYCWLRDAYYVVQALNRLGAADMLENYLCYLRNLVDQRRNGGHVQPVYGVGLEPVLTERIAPHLPGYRGMGPVRIGNQAHEHLQHDVYGQIVLSTVQAFFDERLLRPATRRGLPRAGAGGRAGLRAARQARRQPLGVPRPRGGAHLFLGDVLGGLRPAGQRRGQARPARRAPHYWNGRAAADPRRPSRPAPGTRSSAATPPPSAATSWTPACCSWSTCASPRRTIRACAATMEAVEKGLRRGPFMLRYALPDDFGEPKTAFNFCTFWLIEALHLSGRTEEARELFEEMLGRRTTAGLLSEDIAFDGEELWGNYPQTYSLVGLINCATLLSRAVVERALIG